MGNREFRSKLGRFVHGCPPGPGRRPKPVQPARVSDAELLVSRAHDLRKALDAWWLVNAELDDAAMVQLVAEVLRAREWVPQFVLDRLASVSRDGRNA